MATRRLTPSDQSITTALDAIGQVIKIGISGGGLEVSMLDPLFAAKIELTAIQAARAAGTEEEPDAKGGNGAVKAKRTRTTRPVAAPVAEA